ncbi:MAG: hypothetical protein M1817_000136 [Caeruleum heppii]|nr:MAG: hypothetical protein M1817_000136 [Caeruleum heppii]
MTDKYRVRVSAGPSYDPATHKPVSVNTPSPLHVSNELAEVSLNVRIQNYHGLPIGSPTTSPYFSHPPHTADQYSIEFSFLPKRAIPGNDLIFGNDFDKPIRDSLPPGFQTGLKIVKWAIDPGLDGDVQADKPHLYGPALSSMNILRVGEKTRRLANEPAKEDTILEEGADGDGQKIREEHHVPGDAAARKKWFLDESKRKEWVFEEGRVYKIDFFNPFLDFNHFAIRLPGFSIGVLKYWDGQPLRYTLKNRASGEVYLVVVFTLVLREEVESKETETKGEKDTTIGKPEGNQSEIPPDDDDID